jgi:hypothetical protein
MMSAWVVIVGVALVLAVVVTSLIVGVCLAAARITDAVQGLRGRPRRGGGAGTGMLPPADRGRREGSRAPVDYRRGGY